MKFSHDHKSMSMFINIKWTQERVDGETLVLRHVNCFRFIIIILAFFFCFYFNFEDIIHCVNWTLPFITINHFISRKYRNFINFYWKVFLWESGVFFVLFVFRVTATTEKSFHLNLLEGLPVISSWNLKICFPDKWIFWVESSRGKTVKPTDIFVCLHVFWEWLREV